MEPLASAGRVWIALSVIYFTWGSLYLAIRFVVDESPPMLGMAIRFFLAAALMTAFIVVRSGPRMMLVARRDLIGTMALGALLLGIGNGFNALGIAWGVPTGVTALLCATVPLFVTLFKRLSGHEITLASLLAILVGLAGVAYLMIGTQRESVREFPLIGGAAVLVAACGWALGSFLQPRIWRPQRLVVSTTYQLYGAGVFLLGLAALRGEGPTMVELGVRGWGGMAYLVVIGSVLSFTVFQWLLRHASVGVVATHTYVNPVVAVILGAVVLGEQIGSPVLIGGGAVIVAVALTVVGEAGERSARRN